MYINEVLRRAENYFPSEYGRDEMYSWCDEVSSMLAIEDRNIFSAVTLVADKNNTVLLPEGVEFENVVSVKCGNRVLQKADIRAVDGVMDVGVRGQVQVIYLVPYEPIRVTAYDGDMRIDAENDTIYVGYHSFLPGDTAEVSVGGVSAEVSILDTAFDENDDFGYVITVGKGELAGFGNGDCNGKIVRVVTDKTLCSAPFDSMYVDYVLAKIGMYQRDYDMYSQFMTAFNSRLSAYKRWLVNHIPQDGGRLKNWW